VVNLTKKAVEQAFDLIVAQKKNATKRPQQVKLSQEIAASIKNRQNFLGQGSTGIGKTYAYLVPIILSGEWTLISTATKHLSTQIVEKDLAFLSEIFPDVSFAEMKGARNYFCPAKAQEALSEFNSSIFNAEGEMLDAEKYDEYLSGGKLDDYTLAMLWVLKHTGGSFNYISQCPHKLKPDQEQSLTASSMGCALKVGDQNIKGKTTHAKADANKSKSCSFALEFKCPLANAINDAASAKILVTTHANVASWINNEESMGVLSGVNDKNRPIWVADEAHELEGVLENCWSTTLSKVNINECVTRIEKQNTIKQSPISAGTIKTIRSHCESLLKEVELSFKKHYKPTGGSNYGEKTVTIKELDQGIVDQINELLSILELQENLLRECISNNSIPSNLGKNLLSEISRFKELLCGAKYMSTEESPRVLYLTQSVEKRKEEYAVKNFPLNIARDLSDSMREMNLIALSATMKVNDSFDPIASNLGYKFSGTPFRSFDAGTVFDYRKQGILYVPDQDDCPNPKTNRDEHLEHFMQTSAELIEQAKGGALCLLTTIREAKTCAEYLRETLTGDIEVLSFDDTTNLEELVENFRGRKNSVLVGTRGFFQGLDLPGQTLRLVLINKIPFAPPSPITQEREKLLKQQGENSFMQVSVVPAAQLLAQAAGRLIRNVDDRGIVAVFDPRIKTTGWGRVILNSLPPFYRISSLDVLFKSAKGLGKLSSE
jgi:ATP-dependent DNA helicase DinG